MASAGPLFCLALLALGLGPGAHAMAGTKGCDEHFLELAGSGGGNHALPEYTPADFPRSELSPSAGLSESPHSLYAAWAAKTANRAAQELRNSGNLEQVLEAIAWLRQKLAAQMETPRAHRFGDKRSKGAVSPISDIKEAGPTKEKIRRLARARLRARGAPGSFQKVERNEYVTLEGQRIPASSLEKIAAKFHVRHTEPERIRPIIADVQERLKQVLASPMLSEAERREQFLVAMYGFYNAMPFRRGSAAIGRVLFSAVHQVAFDRKLPPFEDGIDMVAMLLEQDEFVARYRSVWP